MMVRRARTLTLVVAAAALACALSVGAASPAAAVQSVDLSCAREGIDYAADRVLVGLQPGTTMRELDELRHASATLDDAPLTTGDLITCTDQDGVLVDDNDLTPVVTLPLRPGATVAQAIAELQDVSIVATAAPDDVLSPMDDDTGAAELRGHLALTTQAVAPTSVNDPRAGSQWALSAVRLPQAWSLTRCDGSDDVTVGDKSVAVAVLDSGVAQGHEDLVPNLIAQYDAYNAVEGGSTDVAVDGDGHGSHVCGIVSAATNNATGVAGASYNAKLVAIKATNSNGNYHNTAYRSHVINGMSYILEHASELNIRVVNFSAGLKYMFNPYDWAGDEFCKRITQARKNGILFVAAAGNQMTGATVPYWEWPGDYDDCLSVINATQSGDGYTRSNSSNYNRPGIEQGTANETKDITAPGASILSTINKSPWYEMKSGTSMASPLVAGIAALCFAEDPTLSPDDVQGLLQNTANAAAVGQTGWSRGYGYGMVDALAAVSHIMSNTTVDPIPDQAYVSGSPSCPALTVRDAEGHVLVAGTDYDVTYRDNVGLGTATATVTGRGTYVGTTTATFQISLACDAPDVRVTYDGAPHAVTATSPYEGAQIRYSNDGGTTFQLTESPAFTDAGTYPTHFQITYGDLQALGVATMEIARRPVTLTSASASKNYDGRPLTAQHVDVGGMGWAAGEGVTYKVTGSQTNLGSSANAFTYACTAATKPSNYQVTTRTGTLTVNAVQQTMYRLYNPNSGEHFYTSNAGERDAVARAGWKYEGQGWVAPAKSPTPVWRLYNAHAGDHHYTTSTNERDTLVRKGWKSEGIGWYSGGSTPLWRQYNPNAVTGTHNYTPSARERQALVALGWKDEGIAWYGL